MLQRNTIILLFIISAKIANAQIQNQTGQITGGAYSGGTVESFSSPVEGFPNDNYLYPEWNYGSINLKGTDKTDVSEIRMKYNVIRNTIEYQKKEAVLEIDLKFINSFNFLIPHKPEPVKFISLEFEGIRKCFMVNFIGERYSSFIGFNYEVIPADYNPQFDVGSKVDRIKVIEEFYIRDESKGVIEIIKPTKKGLRKYFEDKEELIAEYAKSNLKKIESNDQISHFMYQINSIN